MKPTQSYTEAEHHNTKGETIWAMWQISNWMRQKAKFSLLSAGEISGRAPRTILVTAIAIVVVLCVSTLLQILRIEGYCLCWKALMRHIVLWRKQILCMWLKGHFPSYKCAGMKVSGEVFWTYSGKLESLYWQGDSRTYFSTGWTITWQLHLFLWQ